MNAEYFESHICEELEGAKEYIKKAIELKPMAPSWSKVLVDMSSAELSHSTSLFKMFGEYYKKLSDAYSEVPEYIVEINERITDKYTKMYAEIKIMHEMYSK